MKQDFILERLINAPTELQRGDNDLNPGMQPVRNPLTPAAVLVPLVLRSDGITLLLTQRTAHLNDHAGQISFPGGRVEESDASRIETALRETEEEVGYKIDKVKRVSTVFLSPGIVNEKVHLFIGEYKDEDKTKNGGGVAAENEEIEVLETNFSDALKMIENEEIIDARTIMLLQYLQLSKLI